MALVLKQLNHIHKKGLYFCYNFIFFFLTCFFFFLNPPLSFKMLLRGLAQWSNIRKDITACLFSIHNTISLSCHEQVCLSELRCERYFFHDGRSICRNVAQLNILLHDMLKLLYQWSNVNHCFFIAIVEVISLNGVPWGFLTENILFLI